MACDLSLLCNIIVISTSKFWLLLRLFSVLFLTLEKKSLFLGWLKRCFSSHMLLREAKEPQEECVLCEQDTEVREHVREERGRKKIIQSHLFPYDVFKMACYYVIYLKKITCLPFTCFEKINSICLKYLWA